MVRHHNKLMQEILLLLLVIEHIFYEQSSNFLNLEQVSSRWQSMWTRWFSLDEELSKVTSAAEAV
jgi:hypothetical protein